MTPENGEHGANSLWGAIADSIIEVTERSSIILESIKQALRDDGSIDVDAITAAFDLNEQMSHALREFLERRGPVVFADGVSAQPAEVLEKGQVRGEEDPVGLRTFGELLTSKIDQQLLEEGKDVFTKKEIFDAAKNREAVRKAAKEEGFSAHKLNFSREDAIKILHRVFITPSAAFRRGSELLSRKEVIASFTVGKSNLIDELSSEIGFDWQQNQSVGLQTAMEIRGLVQLHRILTGEKTFRVGSPGNIQRLRVPKPTET